MGEVSIEQIAEDMFKMVSDAQGKKRLKPGDLSKAMIKQYGDQISKQDCKDAIKILIDSGRCVYAYYGGSFVELPHTEGAAN